MVAIYGMSVLFERDSCHGQYEWKSVTLFPYKSKYVNTHIHVYGCHWELKVNIMVSVSYCGMCETIIIIYYCGSGPLLTRSLVIHYL